MRMDPYESYDVTSKHFGILNLVSSSINGIYEVHDYLCRTNNHKLLTRGNYTDLSMILGPNRCIKIANICNYPIDVVYRWKFDVSVNALLISTIVLYCMVLFLFGIITLIICSCGGRVARSMCKKIAK